MRGRVLRGELTEEAAEAVLAAQAAAAATAAGGEEDGEEDEGEDGAGDTAMGDADVGRGAGARQLPAISEEPAGVLATPARPPKQQQQQQQQTQEQQQQQTQQQQQPQRHTQQGQWQPTQQQQQWQPTQAQQQQTQWQPPPRAACPPSAGRSARVAAALREYEDILADLEAMADDDGGGGGDQGGGDKQQQQEKTGVGDKQQQQQQQQQHAASSAPAPGPHSPPHRVGPAPPLPPVQAAAAAAARESPMPTLPMLGSLAPLPTQLAPGAACATQVQRPPPQPVVNQKQQQPQAAQPAATAAAAAAAAPRPPRLAGDRRAVHHVVLEAARRADGDVEARCVNPYTGEVVLASLGHPWCDVPLPPGTPVNLVAPIERGRAGAGAGAGGGAAGEVARCRIDGGGGLLVVHPDVLLSGTVVATALQCTRRAWLSERFGGAPGSAALLGTLGHELLQRALAATARGEGPADEAWLRREAAAIVADNGERLLEVGLSEAAAGDALGRQAPAVARWLAGYVPAAPVAYRAGGGGGGGGSAGADGCDDDYDGGGCGGACAGAGAPPPDAPLGAPLDRGPNGGAGGAAAAAFGCVVGVADIEENIWAPKYGLKGQLDATLLLQLTECERAPGAMMGRSGGGGSGGGGSGVAAGSGSGVAAGGSGGGGVFKGWGKSGGGASGSGMAAPPVSAAAARDAAARGLVAARQSRALAPFEFKTGKAFFTHRAQVSLYLLLLEERYGAAAPHGLLWNAQSPEMALVPRRQGELAPLVARRNALAAHLWQERPAAPPMLHVSPLTGSCAFTPTAVCFRSCSRKPLLHLTLPSPLHPHPPRLTSLSPPPRSQHKRAGRARVPPLPQRRRLRGVPRRRRGRPRRDGGLRAGAVRGTRGPHRAGARRVCRALDGPRRLGGGGRARAAPRHLGADG